VSGGENPTAKEKPRMAVGGKSAHSSRPDRSLSKVWNVGGTGAHPERKSSGNCESQKGRQKAELVGLYSTFLTEKVAHQGAQKDAENRSPMGNSKTGSKKEMKRTETD